MKTVKIYPIPTSYSKLNKYIQIILFFLFLTSKQSKNTWKKTWF